MNTNINMEQLQKDAVDIFNQGFACSESVIYAIRKHFEVDIPDEAIAMSSGFPWGLGRRMYLRRISRWNNVHRIFLRKDDAWRP